MIVKFSSNRKIVLCSDCGDFTETTLVEKYGGHSAVYFFLVTFISLHFEGLVKRDVILNLHCFVKSVLSI